MEDYLKNCPFCNKKPTFYAYHESVDGRDDHPPMICCENCNVAMVVSREEEQAIAKRTVRGNGYPSMYKEFWKEIHNFALEKWNRRV